VVDGVVATSCARTVSAFLFSSRRRHTSSKRDWSSDVCSSDLIIFNEVIYRPCGDAPPDRIIKWSTFPLCLDFTGLNGMYICVLRSEERRVGKEFCSHREACTESQRRSIAKVKS